MSACKAGRDRPDLIGHAERFRTQRVGRDHGRHGVHSAVAHAVNKILRVAAVRARHGVRAVNNFQPRNALQRASNELLVRGDEILHRGKSFFRVVGWGEIPVLVLEISFQQQPGLRIEIRPVFSHQFQILV